MHAKSQLPRLCKSTLKLRRWMHKDSLERFDDFRHRKSRRNDDLRGYFYEVTELASLGAENIQLLTVSGTKIKPKWRF